MKTDVYADLVFVINFVMDFIVLRLVNRFAKKNAKIYRQVLGGFVMALSYCVFIFIPTLYPFNFIVGIIICAAGMLVCFKINSPRELLKILLMTYAAAFFIGGIGTALVYYIDYSNILGFAVNSGSLIILIAAAMVFFVLYKLLGKYLESVLIKHQAIYRVSILVNGTKIEFLSLADTGNSLCEPLSGAPVILAEKSVLKYDMNGFEFDERMRVVPYKSVGNPSGIIMGFRPDSVVITIDDRQIELNKVVIGIFEGVLSAKGLYQGLLNPELLNIVKQH